MIMHKSLSELYSELCIKLRAIAVAEAGGETACVWCRSRKKDHLHDGRCSSSAVSASFTSEQADKAKWIERALELIEELQRISV